MSHVAQLSGQDFNIIIIHENVILNALSPLFLTNQLKLKMYCVLVASFRTYSIESPSSIMSLPDFHLKFLLKCMTQI